MKNAQNINNGTEKLHMLGYGLLNISEINSEGKFNVIFQRGIGISLIETLIELYKKEIINKRQELAKVLLASQSQIKNLFRKEGEPFQRGVTLRQEIIDEIFDFGQYLNRLKPVQETQKDQETHVIDMGKTKVVPRKEGQQFVKNPAAEIQKGEVTKTKKTLIINQQAKSKASSSLLKKPNSTKAIKKEIKYIPNLTPVRGVVLESNIVVIGASVGGPRTITTILRELPRNLKAPILIVQHLTSHFTEAFVDNLDKECSLKVKIAKNGQTLQPGVCYIAPGEKHMEIGIENKRPFIKIYKSTPVNFCMPSIDVLFFSAARVYRERVKGIILTGMGSDGVEGLGAIKASGGNTIAESEETCILYAMPKFAAEKGFAVSILPNYDIRQEIIKFSKK